MFPSFIVLYESHYDKLGCLTRREIGVSGIRLNKKLEHVQHLGRTDIYMLLS
jgi:hypothetical protein